jgi:putative toxin-antitoxin system antitoxin component (TIGR02293 family)
MANTTTEPGLDGPHTYAALLGLRTFDSAGLRERVAAGLPFQTMERFQSKLDLPMTELADLLHIRTRTLSRRKEEGRLRPDESDRLLRASRLFGKILDLFEGDLDKARRWFATPQEALGGATPLHYARTDIGCREVENLVGRLEYGIPT